MPQRNNSAIFSPAFTLVELILVMALLTTLVALVAPTLSHSFRQRDLDQEAVRFVALTEYARDEAVSQGVPMAVWVDPEQGMYGADAVSEYQGRDVKPKQFTLNQGHHFDAVNSKNTKAGRAQIVQFTADGSPDATEDIVDSIRIKNESDSSVEVARSEDGWAYQVVKEGANASTRK